MTSSASTPLIVSTGQPSAAMASFSGSIWDARSSGIDGRFALYSGVSVFAESFSLGIEHAGARRRPVVGGEALQHAEHAVNGAGGLAVRAFQLRQRMERAVQVGRAVDQQERVIHQRAHLTRPAWRVISAIAVG